MRDPIEQRQRSLVPADGAVSPLGKSQLEAPKVCGDNNIVRGSRETRETLKPDGAREEAIAGCERRPFDTKGAEDAVLLVVLVPSIWNRIREPPRRVLLRGGKDNRVSGLNAADRVQHLSCLSRPAVCLFSSRGGEIKLTHLYTMRCLLSLFVCGGAEPLSKAEKISIKVVLGAASLRQHVVGCRLVGGTALFGVWITTMPPSLRRAARLACTGVRSE